MGKLGIVAGNGALPGMLARACQDKETPFFVLALKGHTVPELLPPDIPVKWIRLGAVGQGFSAFKKSGVTDVVFIGGVRRPSLMELRPDWTALRFFLKAGLGVLGDDGLLKAVVHEVERHGFKVIGIDDILPALVCGAGVLGRVIPLKKDMDNIRRGLEASKVLGQADVGQSVIVQEGLVLAVEAIEGTQALIERSALLKRQGHGGVLVKTSKPQQDRRVDLPTIGPETVLAAHKAGLAGIAVEAGGVLITDVDRTVAESDRLNLFLIGV